MPLLSTPVRTRAVSRLACVAASALLFAAGCSDGGSGPGGGAPSVASLSPASAPRGSDAFTLTVTGTGFAPGTSLQWNGTVKPAVFVSATQLTTLVLPADVGVSGTVQVAAISLDGKQSKTVAFTVGPAAPIVNSVSPSSVPAGTAARSITVLGSEFTSTSVVRFNGSPRPTTFVSSGELSAALTADDMATGVVAEIIVSTPDGGASRASQFTVINPAPAVASLSPGYVGTGAGPVTVTVTGSSFVRTSVVRWNGADRPTTYVSATQLTAAIPSTDLASLGTMPVSVRTPTPGGGTSSSFPFAVGISSVATLAMRANDVVADAARGRLYASVAGTDPTHANTIAKIDPATGTVEATVAIGSDPGRMAMSDDGQYLYVGLNGTGEVARVDLATFTAGPKFGLGTGYWSGTLYVKDIDVLPGAPTSVAVSRRYANTSPDHAGVAIYDNGVRRTSVTADNPINSAIEFTSSAASLYGADNETTSNNFSVLSVTASGVTQASTTAGVVDGFDTDMAAASGRLYLSDGMVIDPATSTTAPAGRCTFDSSAMRVVRPDPANNRVFFLSVTSLIGPAPSSRLWACNVTTFGTAGSITVPGVAGGTGRLARWGTDGLAFPAADQLVIVRTSLVTGP
jgi:hypothetical protein